LQLACKGSADELEISCDYNLKVTSSGQLTTGGYKFQATSHAECGFN
jgi:hypothetical protein